MVTVSVLVLIYQLAVIFVTVHMKRYFQSKYKSFRDLCIEEFCLQEVDIGLAADVGTLQILPKFITNHSLFRELVLTSRKFDSKEALQIGLIR